MAASKKAAAKKTPAKKPAKKTPKPEPAPPTSTFREDVAKIPEQSPIVREESLLDARHIGFKALLEVLEDAVDDDKFGRMLEGQAAPMIKGPQDEWFQLAAIADAHDANKLDREHVALLVDGDGRVTVRRGIGKHETIHAGQLRAWIERRDLKPKRVQVDLDRNPIKPPGLRVDPWEKKEKGWTLETETFFADLSEAHIREIQEASHSRQLLLLRKRMKVRDEVQEDPADITFTMDRMDFLRWALAQEITTGA